MRVIIGAQVRWYITMGVQKTKIKNIPVGSPDVVMCV